MCFGAIHEIVNSFTNGEILMRESKPLLDLRRTAVAVALVCAGMAPARAVVTVTGNYGVSPIS